MRPDIRRLGQTAGGGLIAAWKKLFAGPDPEIGPLELAIVAVAAGAYLLVSAIWPAGALGSALVVGGGIQLGVRLWAESKALAAKKGVDR